MCKVLLTCYQCENLLFLQVVQEQFVQVQDPPQLQVPPKHKKKDRLASLYGSWYEIGYYSHKQKHLLLAQSQGSILSAGVKFFPPSVKQMYSLALSL